MGRLARRSPTRRVPRSPLEYAALILVMGVIVLFSVAGLYVTIKDPGRVPINPLVDVYELLSDALGK